MQLSIAEQIILYSNSDEQALHKAELLCHSFDKSRVNGSWYYFKDESSIFTKYGPFKDEEVITSVTDGEDL